jgi:hypothetical protein
MCQRWISNLCLASHCRGDGRAIRLGPRPNVATNRNPGRCSVSHKNSPSLLLLWYLMESFKMHRPKISPKTWQQCVHCVDRCKPHGILERRLGPQGSPGWEERRPRSRLSGTVRATGVSRSPGGCLDHCTTTPVCTHKHPPANGRVPPKLRQRDDESVSNV